MYDIQGFKNLKMITIRLNGFLFEVNRKRDFRAHYS